MNAATPSLFNRAGCNAPELQPSPSLRRTGALAGLGVGGVPSPREAGAAKPETSGVRAPRPQNPPDGFGSYAPEQTRSHNIGQRLARLGYCALLVLLMPAVRADTLTVASQSKGPIKSLVLTFPAPTGASAASTLLVVPLLSPAGELLPSGKLIVWAGHTDGIPLVSAVITVRLPADAGPNRLASAGQRVPEVTLTTNAQGLAEVYLVAPDAPPPNGGADGGTGGNGGGDEGTGE